MSKINFEEDVANIDQTGLESVAELLRKQLLMESEIEDTEAHLKDLKEKHRKLMVYSLIIKQQGLVVVEEI